MDKRTGHLLWLLTVLCAITAFILITSFRGTPMQPEAPPPPAAVQPAAPARTP